MRTPKSKLALSLNEKLEADERTADAGIEALDNNGVITLLGTTSSEDASIAAEEIARNHEGVLSVTNDIEVTHGPNSIADKIPVIPTPRNVRGMY